MTNEGTVIWY